MCLMCEDAAFFHAYWEQVGGARPHDGQQAVPATSDPSRFVSSKFLATAVENAPALEEPGATEHAPRGEN